MVSLSCVLASSVRSIKPPEWQMCPTIQKGRNLVNERGNFFESRGKLETSVLRKQLIIIQDLQVFFLSALKGQTDGLFVICMPQTFTFVPLQQVPICLIVPT